MTRRTVFFGLVDLPVDPILLLLVAALTLTERGATLKGDRFQAVDGVVTRVRDGSALSQVGDRIAIALLVGVFVWLVPVLARRSRRAHRGEPTAPGLVVRPWHRDWLVWLGLFMALLPAVNNQGPTHQVSKPGEALISVADVSWLVLSAQALLEAAVTFVVVVLVLGGLRAAYRALGDPVTHRKVTAPD